MASSLSPLGAAFLLASTAGASAQSTVDAPPPDPARTSIVLLNSFHASDDALDSPLRLSDSFRVTGVSIVHAIPTATGRIAVSAEARETRFRRYAIEDDRALSFGLQAQGRIGDRTELRGALGYAWSDEGDDLPTDIGPIGLRTRSHALSATLEAGRDLGGGLTVEAATAHRLTFAGPTRFEADILPPLRLEPDSYAPALSLSVSKQFGATRLRLGAGYEGVLARPVAGFDQASFALWTLAAELVRTAASGARMEAALGFQAMDARALSGALLMPSYRLAIEAPFGRLRLSGSLSGRFVTDDTDDPVASWRDRGEVEAAWQARQDLTLGLGLFAEHSRDIVLEERKAGAGAYAEIGYAPAPALAIVGRAEAARWRRPAWGPDRTMIAGSLSLKQKL